jgi:uncharacterized protein (TIGR00251 family)
VRGRDVTELRISVRVTPRAGTNRIDGVEDGTLRVRVAAAPADGGANAAVLSVLADALGIPKSAVRLVSGTRSRQKIVAVDAESAHRVEERWPGLRT